MSFFGIPSELAGMQASQARKIAAKVKARERGNAAEESPRRQDEVELGLSGVDEVSMTGGSDHETMDDNPRNKRDSSTEEVHDDPSSDQGLDGRIDLTA